MDPVLEQELEVLVRQRLHELYFAHSNEAPVRDPSTGHVAWRSANLLERSPALQPYWKAYCDELDVAELSKSLDRMMRDGRRRDARGNLARPRVAEQVMLRTAAGDANFDPLRLIDDCWKYALRDETHLLVRRARSMTGRARTRRTPRARQSDARSLVRTRSSADLGLLAQQCPAELAFVLAYEYQAGGLPRSALVTFEALALGTRPLAATLDAIDRRFAAIDEAGRVQVQPTKRRSAALVGLTAQDFAQLLAEVDLRYQPTSLPRLAKRRRDTCLVRIDTQRKVQAPGP